MVSDRRARPATGGYALVALIVIVAVMNVLVASALPYWSRVIQRDKEAELVFRGLQYAEAIRVFQVRFNRLPNTLDELIEVNPRSIRRLWKDPMTNDGEWETIHAQPGQGGQASGRPAVEGTGAEGQTVRRDDDGDRQRRRRVGPIVGVRSRSTDEAIREFMGATSYKDWQFTVALIPIPAAAPDTLLIPRPTSEWIGKSFRDGLSPAQGGGPGQGIGGARRPGDEG